MTNYKKLIHPTGMILALLAVPISASADDVYTLDPLYVTGDLLNSPAERLPASLTILDTPYLESTGNQHFEDTMGYIPNLNYAGGTSRPRYLQIRGIGENSQFGNEIPASSVGFIIDGIDFTGIGTVAGLFDISKIEVLRGPQAAAFGANAMAGMVVVETMPALGGQDGKFSTTIGNGDLLSFGMASGGSFAENNLNYRVSISHYEDNGFRQNSFLDRNDTNKRDEWSSRLKLSWNPVSRLLLEMNLMYFDFNNGYDAWALDNDSFNTTTDEPGQDVQETAAAGIRALWQMTDEINISYSLSVTDSELVYSYDWDWSNPDELMASYGDEVYYGTDITNRTRDVWSHDFRINSTGSKLDSGMNFDWAAGIYFKDFQEEQDYFGILSDYGSTTVALYGQSRVTLDYNLALTLAARLEEYEIEFSNSSPWAPDPPLTTYLGGTEHIWGGKLAMEYTPDASTLYYVSIDRGYKAGGINLDDEVPLDFRLYGSESLINYELGWRRLLLKNRMQIKANIFYMDRSNIQVDSSVQLGDGNTFALYKDNAASGTNYGLELETSWRINSQLEVFANVGLLRTRFDDYSYVDPADNVSVIDLAGRQQAYAPGYTYSVGVDYRSGHGLFLGTSVEGKDSYFFDVLHQQQLHSYALLRLHVGYEISGWTGTLWIKNALDETYDVRGFYFANEPPYYDTPRKWVSQGAPRQFGITINKAI